MALEKIGGSSRGTSQPKISLRKSGSIGINSAAMEEYFDEDEEYAEVYFERETEDQLGIAGKEEETEKSYKITRSNSGGTIAPTSFLKNNDLVPEVSTHYKPYTKRHGSVELVMIDLDEPIGTHGSSDDEPDKPEQNVITEEDAEEAGLEVEEKAEQ